MRLNILSNIFVKEVLVSTSSRRSVPALAGARLWPFDPHKMAPTAIAPASGSRSEPRPVLKTTKEWQIPPRPKPGRRPRSQVQAEQAAAAAAAAAMAPSPQSSNVKVSAVTNREATSS